MPQATTSSRGDDRSHLAEAIATLKLGLIAQVTNAEAVRLLIQEALMMKRALEYYADEQQNYLDDVPMKTNPEDGLLTVPDRGRTALWALRRLDLQLGPAFQIEAPEAEPEAEEEASEVIDAEPVTPVEAPDGKVA